MTLPAVRPTAHHLVGAQPQLGHPEARPAELGPAELGRAELLARLCRIRSEVSALAPVRDTALGEKLLHDLDEVIESADAVGPGPGGGKEHERRPVVALPSGPDYPAMTHR